MNYGYIFSTCPHPNSRKHKFDILHNPNRDRNTLLHFCFFIANKPIFEIYEYLEYHFNNCSDKKMYLRVLNFEVAPIIKSYNDYDERDKAMFHGDLIAKSELVLDWAKEMKTKPLLNDLTPSINEPLARHWALFFTYLNPSVVDIKPSIEQFCKEYNVVFDVETIRGHWYRKQYNNPKKRATVKNLSDIKFVIDHFLKDNLQAKILAESEIKDFI